VRWRAIIIFSLLAVHRRRITTNLCVRSEVALPNSVSCRSFSC
jgi:hypothetical protein